MKRNLMPLLGVAFVAAIVATGIFYGLLLPRLRNGVSANAPATIVVAVRSLERGAVLKADDLRSTPASSRQAPAGAVSSVDQAVGRTLLSPVQAGQALTTALMTDRGVAGGASLAIPTGFRAVTIHPVDSTGVVALARSGSRVDIQVLSSQRPGSMTLYRMLENVEVLHVHGGNPDAQARPVVTLLVPPREADRLSLADAAMRVRVVLRNPSDTASSGPSSMTPDAIFAAKAQ
ncbi:MAG: Flp pilus assembly protein CpaB [Bryobacteraceae bacterium]|jgi:pilus assembly protein CpaB|nr:Flp pilus assembly protein CpaB [Bryobacteraceae bacterium]